MLNYSRTIVFYNLYFGLYVPYATDAANQTRLGISDDQKAKLLTMKGQWDTAFEKYIWPESYGKLSTGKINKLYHLCKTITDGITQQLKNSKSITLEDLDLIIFGIHINNPKSKTKKPTETPAVILKTVTRLNDEFQAINIADPTSGAKPPGTKRLKVYMLVLAADAPVPTIEMLKPEMESGSMRFDIPFVDEQVGMIAYVALCFSNDAGDGEFSAIIACPII